VPQDNDPNNWKKSQQDSKDPGIEGGWVMENEGTNALRQAYAGSNVSKSNWAIVQWWRSEIPVWAKFILVMLFSSFITLAYFKFQTLRSSTYDQTAGSTLALRPTNSDESTEATVDVESGALVKEDRGQPISFELTKLDGSKISSQSFLGKVIVVNFWASWCAPCVVELPTFLALYDLTDKNSVEFALINLDEMNDAATIVQRTWKAEGFAFQGYLDPEKTTAQKLGIESLPTTYVIDKKGRVAMRSVGANDWASEKTVQLIETLVSENN
jgi:thiol-disulfide isomerase/thioredoxin